jgi:hypothetical protein
MNLEERVFNPAGLWRMVSGWEGQTAVHGTEHLSLRVSKTDKYQTHSPGLNSRHFAGIFVKGFLSH